MEESRLYQAISKDPQYSQHFNEVYNDENNWGISADVDPTCLVCGGNTYELLSKIIPKNRVIYDFGAAYGFQAYWFKDHKRYIGINPPSNLASMPFRTENSIWYFGTIQEFFSQFDIEDDSFAICNYVPDTEAEALVRLYCPHCFVNYVTRSDCVAIFEGDKTHP